MTYKDSVDTLVTQTTQKEESIQYSKTKLSSNITDTSSLIDVANTYLQSSNNILTEVQSIENAANTLLQSASTTSITDLSEKIKEIAVNAVDVFIYDTSKDSDGGAWRYRTTGTSWYNETLNTATRGSRREFPAVAVIVAESNKVTIYDGDDPALPMWMVFNVIGVNSYIYQANISSVMLLNGRMAIGQNLTAGISITDFIADKNICSLGHATANYVITDPISKRNGGNRILTTDILIASGVVNDVAMTVLPDAPIDPATGLPIPTIAVATDRGVSVIKDDGTVVDLVDGFAIINTGYGKVSSVNFLDNNQIIFNMDDIFLRNVYFGLIPDIDTTVGDTGFVGLNGFTGFGRSNSISELFAGLNGINLYSRMINTPNGFCIYSSYNVQNRNKFIKVLLDPSNPTSPLISKISPVYNTGWGFGNLKGCFLSSTDTSNLVSGGNLAFNGDFSINDTSDFSSFSGGSYQILNERLEITAESSTYSGAVKDLFLDPGAYYYVEADLISGRGRFTPYSSSGAQTDYNQSFYNISHTGPHHFSGIMRSGTNTGILSFLFRTENIGETTVWDNISVRLADPDRSLGFYGILVNGTITRSPVATGAELVGYSGFSSTNYLEQPYNPDFDFGTGDFSIMGWLQKSGGSTNFVFDRRTPGNIFSDGFSFYQSSGTNGTFTFGATGSSTSKSVSTSTYLQTGQWAYFCIVRRNGVLEMHLNGKLEDTIEFTGNISNNEATLLFGLRHNGTHSYDAGGKLSLWRISATAPTAEQIKKIYEDEKQLFQPGAKCTLYGTSDMINSLAYDEVTNLLYASTSSGTSVFDGLVRVDENDRTPNVISAHNGMVIEG